MKLLSSILLLSLLFSCAHSPERSIASISPLRRFIEAAVKSEDNVLYKSAKEAEDRLLREIKSDPAHFGLTKEASNSLKSLDELQNERIIADVLSEAPNLLKFTAKMRSASAKAITGDLGLAAHVAVKSLNLSSISLTATEQSGLGRDVSLRLKNLKTSLISRKIASPAKATEIYDNLFEAAQQLSAKAKGDPIQMSYARQIIDHSTTISERTGKTFLGKGGCLKIHGRDVLENKADIAYKTMNDVESKNLRNYDEIGEALQKNHSEVTNRTARESCLAIQALTIGKSCGGVFASGLAPKDC